MKLYPYQEIAVDWLLDRNHAYLAADMGLGKTAITITALIRLQYKNVLVVCPAIVRDHWLKEIEKWGGKDSWVVSSYEKAQKLATPFSCIVFDEAHYLKSKDSSRTKALLLNKNAVAKDAYKLIFLSGTPAPNNVSELWPVLKAMGCVGERYSEFVSKYCTFETVYIPGGRSIQVVSGSKRDKLPELKIRIEPYILRITKQQAEIDLPSVVMSTVEVEGVRESCFGDVREKSFIKNFSEGILESGNLEALQAVSSSVATLRRLHSLRKVEAVAKLIAMEVGLGLYEKIVVFAHHQEAIENLTVELADRGVRALYMHGGTSAESRALIVEKFQENPFVSVIICGIQSTGIGINLHAANQVLFLEQSYVPGENAQAIARCARIGQKNASVFVRNCVLNDSKIDARINEILVSKINDLKLVFE